jgi:hypothetical protein
MILPMADPISVISAKGLGVRYSRQTVLDDTTLEHGAANRIDSSSRATFLKQNQSASLDSSLSYFVYLPRFQTC